MHKRTSEDKTPSEARPFSVCGWLCGQRQKPEFKSSRIVAKAKENIRFSSEKRMFCGADRQIRTADLILTKRPWSFFLTIFNVLWSYSLRLACFPSLFKKKVSACSVAVCGWLCGQSAEGEDFRDFHRLHKYGQITVFLTCRSTFAVVLTKNLHKNFFFILIAECFTNTNQLS